MSQLSCRTLHPEADSHRPHHTRNQAQRWPLDDLQMRSDIIRIEHNLCHLHSSHTVLRAAVGPAHPHLRVPTHAALVKQTSTLLSQCEEQPQEALYEHNIFRPPQLRLAKYSVYKDDRHLCYGGIQCCCTSDHLHLECIALGCDH